MILFNINILFLPRFYLINHICFYFRKQKLIKVRFFTLGDLRLLKIIQPQYLVKICYYWQVWNDVLGPEHEASLLDYSKRFVIAHIPGQPWQDRLHQIKSKAQPIEAKTHSPSLKTNTITLYAYLLPLIWLFGCIILYITKYAGITFSICVLCMCYTYKIKSLSNQDQWLLLGFYLFFENPNCQVICNLRTGVDFWYYYFSTKKDCHIKLNSKKNLRTFIFKYSSGPK